MKFKVNYDILKKIDESENGKSFWHFYKAYLCVVLLLESIFTVKDVASGESLKELLKYRILIVMLASLIGLPSSIRRKRSRTPSDMSNALKELELLLYDLKKVEVNTTLELLKDSKLNETKYKIVFTDDSSIPRLKQYKYIDVPLRNGYEETILQEHIFGDKDYEISVQSPAEEKGFRLAKASI